MPEGLATTHEEAGAHSAVQHHFENMEQQREAGTLGMWVFLVTEIMFFGALFLAYTIYRYQYPAAFASASNHLDIRLGAINTAVLIISSFTMAMAVYSTQVGKQRNTIICLILTMILGATFLGIKAVEYHDKYNDHLIPGQLIPGRPFRPEVAKPGDPDEHKLHLIEGATVRNVELFYWIYFAMTIAVVKATLVILYFMHVRYSPRLIWLVIGSALFWLAIMFALTISDYWTRTWLPPL